MAKIYFTLTGTAYYHGNDFLEPGMKIKLEKEPDNKYDKEAILVKLKGLGAIGHVANSVYTVIGDTMSAGRLYDKIGDTAKAKVVYVTSNGAVCKLCKSGKKEPAGKAMEQVDAAGHEDVDSVSVKQDA